MRRTAAALLVALPLAAACSDAGSPVVESTDTALSAESTTSTTAAPASELPFSSLNLTLRGADVVPGPGGPGIANVDLTYDGDEMCLTGSTSNVGAITAAHVHAAAAGAAGDPVVDFALTTAADGDFDGCSVVGAEGGVVFDDPTNYYVDLHTADLPDGAVRAQVG